MEIPQYSEFKVGDIVEAQYASKEGSMKLIRKPVVVCVQFFPLPTFARISKCNKSVLFGLLFRISIECSCIVTKFCVGLFYMMILRCDTCYAVHPARLLLLLLYVLLYGILRSLYGDLRFTALLFVLCCYCIFWFCLAGMAPCNHSVES